jgi:hypothetical protein
MEQNNEIQTPEAVKMASRRNMIKLGAAGAVAVVTIKPAMAQTATSLVNCQIQVPSNGMNVAADGTTVSAGTADSFEPAARAYTGEEIKAAMHGGEFPDADYNRSQAYINYIKKLQHGQSGFTCYASLQAR